jgi:hypothetical protein
VLSAAAGGGLDRPLANGPECVVRSGDLHNVRTYTSDVRSIVSLSVEIFKAAAASKEGKIALLPGNKITSREIEVCSRSSKMVRAHSEYSTFAFLSSRRLS